MVGADVAVAEALRVRGWPERPLVDQPLALDLLNTRWVIGTTWYDLLDDDDLTAAWLADRGLECGRAPRGPLREARDALALVLADPSDHGSLDALLAHGRLRLTVTAEHHDVADPDWRAAWACLRDYLLLRASTPDRLRKCANPDCVLHFQDTSRTGRRQWCSMTACGNRLKARRHYARSSTVD